MQVELASLAHAGALHRLVELGVPGAADIGAKVRAGELCIAEAQDAAMPLFFTWLRDLEVAE